MHYLRVPKYCKKGYKKYGTGKCHTKKQISSYRKKKSGCCGGSCGSKNEIVYKTTGKKPKAGRVNMSATSGTSAAFASGVADKLKAESYAKASGTKQKVDMNSKILAETKGRPTKEEIAKSAARETGKRTFAQMSKNPNPVIGIGASVAGSFF